MLGRQFLILIGTALLLVGGGVAQADSVVWQENFESYAVGTFPGAGGWFIRPGGPGVGPSAQFVTDVIANSPIRSLRLEGAEGLGINVQRIIAPTDTYAIEAMVNTTRQDSRSVLIGFGTQDEVYASVQFRHNGVVAARSGFGYTALPVTFTANTWIKLKVVVHSNTEMFDVYFNDALVGQNLPIYPLPQPIDRVLLNVDNNGFGPDAPGFAPGGTVSYFDDVRLIDLAGAADADNDGVIDLTDNCLSTPAGAVVDPSSGCSIAELCPCSGPFGMSTPWKNHGKYVSCVSHASQDFLSDGLITSAQRSAIMSAAGSSSCGH